MIKTNVVLITQKLLYMLLFSYIQMKEVQVLHVYAIKNTLTLKARPCWIIKKILCWPILISARL